MGSQQLFMVLPFSALRAPRPLTKLTMRLLGCGQDKIRQAVTLHGIVATAKMQKFKNFGGFPYFCLNPRFGSLWEKDPWGCGTSEPPGGAIPYRCPRRRACAVRGARASHGGEPTAEEEAGGGGREKWRDRYSRRRRRRFRAVGPAGAARPAGVGAGQDRVPARGGTGEWGGFGARRHFPRPREAPPPAPSSPAPSRTGPAPGPTCRQPRLSRSRPAFPAGLCPNRAKKAAGDLTATVLV